MSRIGASKYFKLCCRVCNIVMLWQACLREILFIGAYKKDILWIEESNEIALRYKRNANTFNYKKEVNKYIKFSEIKVAMSNDYKNSLQIIWDLIILRSELMHQLWCFFVFILIVFICYIHCKILLPRKYNLRMYNHILAYYRDIVILTDFEILTTL